MSYLLQQILLHCASGQRGKKKGNNTYAMGMRRQNPANSFAATIKALKLLKLVQVAYRNFVSATSYIYYLRARAHILFM